MFDVFIKFSDYSLLVRALVASWIIFTAIICIVAMIAKPIIKEKDQLPPEAIKQTIQPTIHLKNIRSFDNGGKGVNIKMPDANVIMDNVQTSGNKGGGIEVDTSKKR